MDLDLLKNEANESQKKIDNLNEEIMGIENQMSALDNRRATLGALLNSELLRRDTLLEAVAHEEDRDRAQPGISVPPKVMSPSAAQIR